MSLCNAAADSYQLSDRIERASARPCGRCGKNNPVKLPANVRWHIEIGTATKLLDHGKTTNSMEGCGLQAKQSTK